MLQLFEAFMCKLIPTHVKSLCKGLTVAVQSPGPLHTKASSARRAVSFCAPW
jgi:hypothetical protein